jgi:hypothetical protein
MEFLLHVLQVPSSNVGPETDCLDCDVFVIFAPFRKIPE